MLISPDGWYYLRAAKGDLVPRPYSRRWLLPRVFGADPRRWVAFSYASLLATPFAAWGYFDSMGLVGRERLFAAALLSVLPGVWRCSLRFPVLVDAPSFACALVVAMLARDHGAACIPLALVGGAMRETVPVFAALWSWSPWPLVGMLAVGWFRRAASPDSDVLSHPWRSAWATRRAIGLDASLYLRPFGAALAAFAVAPTPQVLATIAAAVAQLFVAVDAVRLLVWCAPVLVAAAVHVLPPWLWGLALLLTVFQRDDRV